MEMVLVHYGNGQQQVDWGGIRTPYGCCRYFKTGQHAKHYFLFSGLVTAIRIINAPAVIFVFNCIIIVLIMWLGCSVQ